MKRLKMMLMAMVAVLAIGAVGASAASADGVATGAVVGPDIFCPFEAPYTGDVDTVGDGIVLPGDDIELTAGNDCNPTTVNQIEDVEITFADLGGTDNYQATLARIEVDAQVDILGTERNCVFRANNIKTDLPGPLDILGLYDGSGTANAVGGYFLCYLAAPTLGVEGVEFTPDP